VIHNLAMQVRLRAPPDNGGQRCAIGFPGAGNNTIIGEIWEHLQKP
jgi:hypothetical protein